MHFEVGTAAGGHVEPAGVAPPGRWCRARDQALVAALARRCDAAYRRGDPAGARQSQLCLEQILYLLWEDATHRAPGPVDAALDEITLAIRQDPSRRWTVAARSDRRSTPPRSLSPRCGASPAPASGGSPGQDAR